MPYYCVNRNAQSDGYHEVHETYPNKCSYLPDPKNRIELGSHKSCKDALLAAKTHFPKVDGCAHCCPECNTR